MFEIAIGLAVVVLVLAVPALRRAVLSLLGLFTIVAVGSVVFTGLIWALYESKDWLVSTGPDATQEASPFTAEDKGSIGTGDTAEADLASALADEEEQILKDKQERLEEEKLAVGITAARARVVLEEDHKLAAQAAAYPLPPGVGEKLGDIMAIRIPPWRDKEVAAAQKESIRTWLQSLGLSAEETASIVTAKAWGSLYDMWVTANPDVGPPSPAADETRVASTDSEQDPPSEAEAASEREVPQESAPEAEQTPSPVASRIPPRRQVTRPPPQRVEPAAPTRRLPQKREVGPFGY